MHTPKVITVKEAVTHYKVLERLGYVTLIQCELETGRTHQIRVHMQHIGHPLFNDEIYGGDRIVKGTVFTSTNSLLIMHLLFALGTRCTQKQSGLFIPKQNRK